MNSYVVSGNSLLGFISNVGENTSTVTLYSADGNEKKGYLSKFSTEITIKGIGSGTLESHIPRDISIAKGDVITDRLNPELVIGIVQDIQFDERDPFKKILIQPEINLNSLIIVSVIS